ncbi:VirK/YbjX family protein [Orbaceae bacterium ESL0721]|nr:VirK/YbjX family protein [Orbaceae bacterium ESL0721]
MQNIKNMPKPKSRWQLFYWLCSGKLQLNSLWSQRSYRYKFFFRTLFLSPTTLKWLNKLYQYPLLGDFFSCQTNLPCKLQRPYLAACMSQRERFLALSYHYDFLTAKSDRVTKAFYNPESPFLLASLTVKNEMNISIQIQSRNKFAREGEISLYFIDGEGKDLATLTFSIIKYQQKSTLFIAGLQGTQRKDAKSLIQKTTKACYGLFPKRIVVDAALIIANYFQLQQIMAVGNRTHVYNNWRYSSRNERVYSDYDDFWLTLDAQKSPNQLYILPNKIPRKSLEDVASKKRSEYRNRYILLDQLTENIQATLTSLTDSK